jgi:hypothetical protein
MIRGCKGIRPVFRSPGDAGRLLVGHLGHGRGWLPGRETPPAGARDGAVERPGRLAPREIRSISGPRSPDNSTRARVRGRDLARRPLGEAVWYPYRRRGYLDALPRTSRG